MRKLFLFLAFIPIATAQITSIPSAAAGSTGTVTSVGLLGTANQITVTGSSPITTTGSFTLSFPAGGVTLPGTTTGTFTGNVTGNATGSAGTVTSIASHASTELSDTASIIYTSSTNKVIAGPIGIGTIAAIATEFQVASTSTSSPRGIMSSQYNTGTDGARFHMRKARGTEGTPTVIVTGDNLGRLVASGYDGGTYLEMGTVIFASEGTIASTRVPTNIQFLTATDAAPSVLTEAFRVNSKQQFGIGTGSTITAGFHDHINGALSSSTGPGALFDGTWVITGGTATTTKPYVLIEPAGTTSTGWNAAGTAFGVNAATGFVGSLIDLQLAGVSKFSISQAGSVTAGSMTSNIISASNNDVSMNLQQRSFTTATNPGIILNSGTWTNSSGVALAIKLIPTYNQTSTAGATDFLINRTQTAVGSGAQLFLDMQVATVSKASVSNLGLFSGAAYASTGTKFTLTGCSAGTTVGGASAGQFASGTTGACTVVITMNGATGLTATNGWSCNASDLTTPANLFDQSATTTTTVTLTGTTVSGDTITFHCEAY